MSRFKILAVILMLAFPISVMGETMPDFQETESAVAPVSNSLKGKHGFELTLGLLSRISTATDVSVGEVRTESEADGLIGSIGYIYWFEDDWAINFRLGVSDVDATTYSGITGVLVESATVVPMLLGVRYQPSGLINSDVVRPYVSASVGPYFGFVSEVRTGVTTAAETRSETALGSRIAMGTDLSLSRLFRLGIAAGYCFVTDFENRIGSEKNHSSPEFSMSFGIVLGK
jgi:outer membrane protein W